MPHAPTPGTTFVMPRSNGAPKPVAPIPSPTPQIPVEPVEPAAISAPLDALSENWPEGLRLEIRQSNLADAQVLLPANLIEPALKRGRVTFTWRNLRPLIQPTPPPASVHDGIELELPLNVIAPLFFARQKTAPRPQAVKPPPAEIPNLFFGFPQPETPQPKPFLQPETPQPKPPPARMPEPQSKPPARMPEPPPIRPASKPMDAKPVNAKLSDTNYYIWSDTAEAPRVDETEYKRAQRPATDFSSRYTTPNEVVARAMELPGVVGALVALPDGLKVASQIPSDFNADTLAAFLPQIFDRVSQSTRELRMGALNNFNFTVGNVPWKIFRVNAVYFAAFGRAGEALPTVQLAALAAELDRKKQ
jgi:predicted regulator of Ras-like GTPase activity (Roadblock/LC7/MglB family)